MYIVRGPKTIDEMSWVDVDEAIKAGAEAVLLVVGATENHGPHNPLSVDTAIALEHARIAADKLGKEGIRVLIAPPIPYGMSHHHLPFPGSIALRPSTLQNLIVDVCQSLIDAGINNIILLAGHSGAEQIACMVNSRLELVERFGVSVGIFDRATGDRRKQIEESQILKSKGPDTNGMEHAGEEETSEMMAVAPKLVRKDRLTRNLPKEALEVYRTVPALRYPCRKGGTRLRSGRYAVAPGPREFTAGKGFAGDVTVASEETGRKVNDMIAEQLAKFVKSFLKEAKKEYK